METVLKVKALSKFGFFVEGEEKGIYFDRSLLEADRGKFVPGAEIPVILRVADSGTKYVTAVTASKSATDPSINELAKSNSESFKKSVTPKSEVMSKAEVMSKSDWASKDRSMMIGGIAHDAAMLVNASAVANCSLDVMIADYKRTLIELLKIREEVK